MFLAGHLLLTQWLRFFFLMLCVAVEKRNNNKKHHQADRQKQFMHPSLWSSTVPTHTGHQPICVGVRQRSRCQLLHSNLTPSFSVFRRQNVPASCLHACFLVDKMYFISSFCTAGSGFGSGWNSEDAWPVQRKKWHNPWIKGIFLILAVDLLPWPKKIETTLHPRVQARALWSMHVPIVHSKKTEPWQPQLVGWYERRPLHDPNKVFAYWSKKKTTTFGAKTIVLFKNLGTGCCSQPLPSEHRCVWPLKVLLSCY